jgi:hypothetical protein
LKPSSPVGAQLAFDDGPKGFERSAGVPSGEVKRGEQKMLGRTVGNACLLTNFGHGFSPILELRTREL